MMPKPVWIKPKENLLGTGDDKWVDLSKVKKPVYDEETGNLIESPKSEQTKHQHIEHPEPAKHLNPEPAKHGQVSKHRNASTWTAEQARKNGAKGGENRKIVVSKQERSNIARQGAQARWMKAKGGQSN
jgi:hypothetical protein